MSSPTVPTPPPAEGNDDRVAPPIHYIADAPTSLHGNGAAALEPHTTRDAAAVTCRLCLTLLAREADA